MITRLPVELKLLIMDLSPYLRYANRELYILHNEMFKMKTIHLIGDEPILKISKLLHFFSSTFDFWNGALTKLFPDLNWVLIYSLLRNRKIFFQVQDFAFQADSNNALEEPHEEYVHIKNVHAFHYHRIIYLPNGNYNFQIALRNLRSSRGLGTTRFRLLSLDEELISTYPPSIINEILPDSKLSVLNLGEFSINNPGNELTEVEIIIEEIGTYPKLDLIFDYVDFKPIKGDYLFYTIQGNPFEEYHRFVNKIEKACHLAIDEIWTHPISPESSPTDSLDSFNEVVEQSNPEDLKNYAKEFYTTSTRSVKMYYPSDQRHFRERKTGNLLDWRVPLLR